ncbi:MAG: RNA polymerase sigma factor [Candidatus Magasanikbacteria bacterium]|nr:RNA polymerase sigma factor [Candidatus Magasanikbacteria bacterium]
MSRSKISEKILLFKLHTRKDPEAFAKLYDIYARRIYSFIFFKVGNREEAEDITSEVFLKAWRYINEKKNIESFSGLLYKLARNSIIDLYRSKASQKELLSVDQEIEAEQKLGSTAVWEAGFEKKIGDKIEVQKIILALQKLKHEYREVVTLRYVDELEISEIAEITGKGHISIRVTLHRGLKKLKQILDQNKKSEKQ